MIYNEFKAILEHAKVDSDEAFFDAMIFISGMSFLTRWGYYLYTYTWIKNRKEGWLIRRAYLAYILLLRMQWMIRKKKIKRMLGLL